MGVEVTVGVTGGHGFVGWHLRARLLAQGRDSIVADRQTFAHEALLDEFVRVADVIVHVAGVNRASTDEEVETGNCELARQLVAAMQRTGCAKPVAYTNSTQIDRENVYGRSKAAAAQILEDWCKAADMPFLNLVLPHVFGEFGRPHYNSVLTTFAHCLATHSTPEIHRSGELELVHAQDVAQHLAAWAQNPADAGQRLSGRSITVGEVWDLLERQSKRYRDEGVVPRFGDRFELQVFNALRSQLYEAGCYPIAITTHRDHRGAFAELSRADSTGQTSISTSFAGIQRGDHFHFDKVERFVVVGGQAEIKVRRVLTDVVRSFTVSGDDMVAIDMPPLCTHNIVNTGDEPLTTVFWAGDHFDPMNPDTYAEPVEQQA